MKIIKIIFNYFDIILDCVKQSSNAEGVSVFFQFDLEPQIEFNFG